MKLETMRPFPEGTLVPRGRGFWTKVEIDGGVRWSLWWHPTDPAMRPLGYHEQVSHQELAQAHARHYIAVRLVKARRALWRQIKSIESAHTERKFE